MFFWSGCTSLHQVFFISSTPTSGVNHYLLSALTAVSSHSNVISYYSSIIIFFFYVKITETPSSYEPIKDADLILLIFGFHIPEHNDKDKVRILNMPWWVTE
jgi:hypothetical protein